MASTAAGSSPEPIHDFLQRLKLAEKYVDIFVQNGYHTVDDCVGLTDDALRELGVTLPGHYRRILSKLPGAAEKRKSQDPQQLQEISESLTQEGEAGHSSAVAKDNKLYENVDLFVDSDGHTSVSCASNIHVTSASRGCDLEKPHQETYFLAETMSDEATFLRNGKSSSTHIGTSPHGTKIDTADVNKPNGTAVHLKPAERKQPPKKPPRSPEKMLLSLSNLRESPELPLATSPDTHLPQATNINNSLQLQSTSDQFTDVSQVSCNSKLKHVDSLSTLPVPPESLLTGDTQHTEESKVTESFMLPSPPVESAAAITGCDFPLPPVDFICPENGVEDNRKPSAAEKTESESNPGCNEGKHSIPDSNGSKEPLAFCNPLGSLGSDCQMPTGHSNEQSYTEKRISREASVEQKNVGDDEQRQGEEGLKEQERLEMAPNAVVKSQTSHDEIHERDVRMTSLPDTATPKTASSMSKVTVKTTLPSVGNEPNDWDVSAYSPPQHHLVDDVISSDGSMVLSAAELDQIHMLSLQESPSKGKNNSTIKHRHSDVVQSSSRRVSSPDYDSLPRASNSVSTPFRIKNASHVRSLDDLNHVADSLVTKPDDDDDESKESPSCASVDGSSESLVSSSTDHVNTVYERRPTASGGMVRKPVARMRKKDRKGSRPLSSFFKDTVFSVRQSSTESFPGDMVDMPSSEPQWGAKHSNSRNSVMVTSSSTESMIDVTLTPEDDRRRRYTTGHQALGSHPSPMKKTKEGWLWKHGGKQRQGPLRKRWVVFDGAELRYYENDTKTEVSKGMIPIEVILRLQFSNTEPKIFHIQTKGGRKYIFHAENVTERLLWTSTLQASKMYYEKHSHAAFKPGGSMYMPYKEGLLKLDGTRQKVYLATKGEEMAYYKSVHEFNFGQPVAKLQMNLAAVKDVDKKKFQIVFPYQTFSFTADNEEEKRTWIEALSDSVAESLSDYKVVTDIWALEANRQCADCGRENPDWASINLAIVICKHCAGVHRELGVHNSKVRSLKMDVKIWSEQMRALLVTVGNKLANEYWAANLCSSEAITDMADKKQRCWHINNKYVEMHYLRHHPFAGQQEKLNKALIDAVRNDSMKDVYHLVFSGADPNCNTNKEHGKTPYLLAKYLKYGTLAEFFHQNGATEDASPDGHITDRSATVGRKDSTSKPKPPVTIRDYLYKFGGDFRSGAEESKPRPTGLGLIRSALQQGEFQKRMCVLENNTLKYFDPERITLLKDEIDCSELISIGISQPEQATKAGLNNCFELGRNTGRTYLFCADRKDLMRRWTRGLLQAILPPVVQNAIGSSDDDHDFDRVGRLRMRSQHRTRKGSDWSDTWCRLKAKRLFYFHNDARTMEALDLRKLVQLGVDLTQDVAPSSTGNSVGAGLHNKEQVPAIMLVFREKSFYFRSVTKSDGELWYAALKRNDGECGAKLEDQQLTAEGIPIILEKCMTFVEQFGLRERGIYRLSGTHGKTTQLLNDFKQNARETQMGGAEGDVSVHDVSNALKRWFKALPGALLTEAMHAQWVETAALPDEHHTTKLESYKLLLDKLPDINRCTLKVLLNHLNNVAGHERENDMSQHNLAIVFGPTLMQHHDATNSADAVHFGKTSQEIACVGDLLRYFDWLFDVTEVDREKERRMLEAKGKIMQATQQQNMLTTLDYDMMVPIFIKNKDDQCVNYRVNLTAGELVARICHAHSFPEKSFGLFEVVMDGEGERSLHHTEHVLSVIKSWSMPSSNYLLAKHDYIRDKLRSFKSNDGSPEVRYEGQLRVHDSKKRWNKVQAALKRSADDSLSLHFGKGQQQKGSGIIPLAKYSVYVGVDRKLKPPGARAIGFTLLARGEPARAFVVDTETHLFRWIGHIMLHRHPGGFDPPQRTSPMRSGSLSSPVSDASQSHASPFSPVAGAPRQFDMSDAVLQAAIQRRASSSTDGSRPGSLVSDQQEDDAVFASGGRREGSRPQSVIVPDHVTAANVPHHRARPISALKSPTGDGRAMLGMKLHSELSNVLKNRTK